MHLAAVCTVPVRTHPPTRPHTPYAPFALQIVAFFVALATVIYSTYSAGVSSSDLFGMRGGGSAEDGTSGGDLPYRADFFHLIFALASMYERTAVCLQPLPMLLTLSTLRLCRLRCLPLSTRFRTLCPRTCPQ